MGMVNNKNMGGIIIMTFELSVKLEIVKTMDENGYSVDNVKGQLER